jgi:1-acyl-sn-glycerol-3-phosphate acyltransferase
MRTLRSLAFNVAFYAWTAGLAILFLPTLLLPARASLVGQRLWARGIVALMGALVGIRFEVRGREHLPPGGCLVAAKHQSAFDTMIFPLLLHDPVVVLKRELVLIPVYGWFALKWGMIPVDRKAGPKALRAMLKAAKPRVAEGRPIFIFPEGTRSAPGAPPAYKPGVAALYRDLGVPCVPVALNSGLYWPRRSFLKRPGTIVIEFLPPLAPGLARGPFMAELERRIETATAVLIAEGTPHRG